MWFGCLAFIVDSTVKNFPYHGIYGAEFIGAFIVVSWLGKFHVFLVCVIKNEVTSFYIDVSDFFAKSRDMFLVTWSLLIF